MLTITKERARSISPTKDSPIPTTPPQITSRADSTAIAESTIPASNPDLSTPPELRSPFDQSGQDRPSSATMEPLTHSASPSKENTMPLDRANRESDMKRNSSVRASPSSAMPSRSSTLSWQRRPTSQSSDRPRSRPLSIIASENAARSPRTTPEPSPALEEASQMSREQIAESLAAKDPAWFKQTADRGLNSRAFRKNQVEDIDVVDVSSSNRVQLPGMSREMKSDSVPDKIDQPSSPPMDDSSSKNRLASSSPGDTLASKGIGSPVPQTAAQRLDPSGTPKKDADVVALGRSFAMSPSQGRISPERLDRPVSPTKGMGGFVQSAMMKRSDSVNKRWSVQSPPGLSRGNSVSSNRSSYSQNPGLGLSGVISPSPRETYSLTRSRDTSPSLSRPTSSHSNATIVQNNDRPGTSDSMKSNISNSTKSTSNDGFIKPSLPASRSQSSLNVADTNADQKARVETTPPTSPSKASGRWSPTKASWLESALNKPDSPKPKAPITPQQPSWMAEISKAKQRSNLESARSPSPTTKHEIKFGGLLRSPPIGGSAKPLGLNGPPEGFTSASITKLQQLSASESTSMSDSLGSKQEPPLDHDDTSEAEATPQSSNLQQMTPMEVVTPEKSIATSAANKVKPETPPKKDLRSTLKSRQVPQEKDTGREPEFKNVFGQLRRTKTQNYIAPDELKDNILRGKAGLSVTGGPKKNERKDELKEAILQKKQEFRKTLPGPIGHQRHPSSPKESAPLPEALAKKVALNKSATIKHKDQSPSISSISKDELITAQKRISGIAEPPTLSHESSAPDRLEQKDASSDLAARFNPALAGLLARGPPPSAGVSQPTSDLSTVENKLGPIGTDVEVSKPQLTHITKARARGPRRKAPSAAPSSAATAYLEATGTDASLYVTTSSKTSARLTEQTLKSGPVDDRKLSKVFEEPENEGVTPGSVRRLDMKRRSQFLEEVSNTNERDSKHVEISEKPSRISKVATIEDDVKHELKPNEAKTVSPQAPKPKLASLSPAVPKRPYGSAVFTTPSPETKRKLTPPPLSLSPTKGNDIPVASDTNKALPLSPREQEQTSASRTSPVTSTPGRINAAASVINRPAPIQQSSKSPITLPTRADEDVAMVAAGLRSPSAPGISNVLHAVRGGNATHQIFTRPLPIPPTKPSSLPSTTKKSEPSGPGKLVSNLAAPISEASKLLGEFFDDKGPSASLTADTSSILSSRVDDVKIKTLRSQIVQLTEGGKKQAVPSHQERVLFEGNMYLCTHIFGNALGRKITQVYFWVGDDVPEATAQDAIIFASREAKATGGSLIHVQQGKEPPEFIEALGGIIIIRRGTSNRYDSLSPHILCGRRHVGQIVFDEVDFSPASFCSGFPYLISAHGGKTYLWKGKGSSVDELSCARLIGMDSGLTGDIEEVEDGNEPASFLSTFEHGAKINKSAEHWRLKPNYDRYRGRLFCADAAAKSQVSITTDHHNYTILLT